MLATLREFASEQTAQRGEAPIERLQHANYYEELVKTAEWPPDVINDAAALGRLADDLDNIRAALATLEHLDPARMLELAASLGEFYEYHGELSEGDHVLRRALAHSDSITEARV